MSANSWKKRAEALFFTDKKNLREISGLINISVRSISRHFNSLPAYHMEKTLRKAGNRKKYFREYKRKSRADNIEYDVTRDTLRLEHEEAAKVLSRERC